MSLTAMMLALVSAQDVPTSKTCADGTVVLSTDTCPEPAAILRGRCELRGGEAPALHRAWAFRLSGKVMEIGPESDARRYFGAMTERGKVLQGTLFAKEGGRIEVALSTEAETIDGRDGYRAVVLPRDGDGKPLQAPSRYVCRASR